MNPNRIKIRNKKYRKHINPVYLKKPVLNKTKEFVMENILQFGERVEGYNIAVVNEREVRAAAGIMFVIAFISFMICQLKLEFVMLKYVITMFLVDMTLRVFINPRFAPSLILGRLIVKNQTPEYVNARPKRFAWAIGFLLAALMFGVQVVANVASPVTGLGCTLCLTFLFFESAFGICIGCMLYSFFYKEKAELCPGGTCEPGEKEDIQKTSRGQFAALALSVVFILTVGTLFHENLKQKPNDVFGVIEKSDSTDLKAH